MEINKNEQNKVISVPTYTASSLSEKNLRKTNFYKRELTTLTQVICRYHDEGEFLCA